MQLLAFVFSSLIAVLGAIAVVAPVRAVRIARAFDRPGGLQILAAIRLAMGAVLFLAGPHSRQPGPFRICGVVIAAAGVVTLFLGLDRQRRIIDWWSARGLAFQRTWAAVGLAFGVLLAAAVAPF